MSGALRLASSVDSFGATTIVLTVTGESDGEPWPRAASAATTACAVASLSTPRPRWDALTPKM